VNARGARRRRLRPTARGAHGGLLQCDGPVARGLISELGNDARNTFGCGIAGAVGAMLLPFARLLTRCDSSQDQFVAQNHFELEAALGVRGTEQFDSATNRRTCGNDAGRGLSAQTKCAEVGGHKSRARRTSVW
jgi:hypothetical protein